MKSNKYDFPGATVATCMLVLESLRHEHEPLSSLVVVIMLAIVITTFDISNLVSASIAGVEPSDRIRWFTLALLGLQAVFVGLEYFFPDIANTLAPVFWFIFAVTILISTPRVLRLSVRRDPR